MVFYGLYNSLFAFYSSSLNSFLSLTLLAFLLKIKKMKTLKTILLLSVFISLLIHFINYAALGFNQDFLWNWKKPMINFVYAACIGLTNILFFSYLNRLFSWEKSPKKMLLIGVFGSVFLSTLAFFVARVTHFVALESYTFLSDNNK